MASYLYKLFFVIFTISVVNSERLHEQIYSSIEGGAACFRRLNGTHQTGCASGDNGAVGVVQMIRHVSDAQWLVQNATAGPYMAVVDTKLFYDVIELLMENPPLVAGVLLYDNATNSASFFTQESRCPNEYSSAPGSTCSSSVAGGFVWNEKGTGLLRRNIPFPIFYLPAARIEEIVKIDECYQKFNLDKSNQVGNPLCSLQLHSFMFAAINSEVCMRRSASSALLTPTKVCDPLGDNNVYYSLFPRTKDDKPGKPVTLVTARIDSASMFDGVSPGAASSVVGMVALLTAATTLSQMIPAKDAALYNQNVLWTLFNGESFDYIGSQRVAYDISRGVWPPASPLATNDIRLHVEIGQIGGSLSNDNNDTSWPFHAFVPYNEVITEITEFVNVMLNNSLQYNISLSPEFTTNLPPSSLHSFRRILKNVTESGELPELLLADYKNTFTNKYYQSALDEYDNINFNYHNITVDGNGTFISTEELISNGTMKENEAQVKIARLATALARTLYQTVTGQGYTGSVAASAHLVDEMLYCFLRSQACRLLLAAEYAGSSDETPPPRPAPLYVGVAAWAGTAPVLAGHLLALLTGQVAPVNKTGCDALVEPGLTSYWLRGFNNSGVCLQTTMNISAAVSPAFIIPDYSLSTGMYSTWTESVWQAMWARVFVVSGGGGARGAGAAGAVLTLLCAALTYWLKRHADKLFSTSSVPRSEDAVSGILRTVNC